MAPAETEQQHQPNARLQPAGTALWRGSMPTKERARIETEVASAYRGVPSVGRRSNATRRDILDRTVRLYADLWSLGYVLKLESLRTTHLLTLVQFWRAGVRDVDGNWLRRPMTRRTAANFWTAVNTWLPVIGKAGMGCPFADVWPNDDAPDPAAEDRPVRRGGIEDLDDGTCAAILAAWRDDPAKRTHYWCLRAARELGLGVRDAIAFNPRAASARIEGKLLVTQFAQRKRVLVDLDTDARRALVDDLIAFTDAMRRNRLGWPHRDVGTDAHAERRLRKAVAYARDRILGRGGPAPEGVQS